ncbi:MAG: cation-transporting P-type ATPase, partial [Clostridia bacterium]|nr:cation-transporting P-type ATPase [Clostridia bacterium]
MSEKPKRKLKIKTAPAEEADSGFVFSPEEMLPFEVAEALESDLVAGKTEKQVKKAKRRFGANELRSDFHLSFRESLKNQLKGMIGVFLALSSLVMFAFHPDEPTYVCMAAVITAIMFFNAFMELRASRALKTPKKYSSLKAKVIRDGEETTIDSLNLIPGDLINVESGMMVPADCRLVDDFGLAVLETHVSGKEGSVTKDSTYIADGPEPVCGNMIYAGSIVTSGHASAIVCRTGEETMMRKMHPAREDYIPGLLKYVISLCRFTSAASAVICLVLLFIGIAAGADITKWFICALAIGASSLCDGMVSLCASSLGFGAKKMANDGMVIKNYGSIQTLAAVNTVMCGRNIAFPPRRIALTGLYFSGRNYDREKRPDDQ